MPVTAPASPIPKFLSQAECEALAKRVASFAVGGGETAVIIQSSWIGSLRWINNQVANSGELRENIVYVVRSIRGAIGAALTNQIDPTALTAAVRRAERGLLLNRENPESKFGDYSTEPYLHPNIWSDATYHLKPESRSAVARDLMRTAVAAGVMSSGSIEVSAHGLAIIDPMGHVRYYPYTLAQCSMTVRDETASGCGWAGVDFSDWRRIDGPKLAAIALNKCLTSRNPVAMEPGRYTTILEPQAVCDLMAPVLENAMSRGMAEGVPGMGPFTRHNGESLLGQRVFDERITISADPMDPDLGFPPFAPFSFEETYHPVTWVEHGVLNALSYDRQYAIRKLGRNTGLPNSCAFRISGGDTSIDRMIATTQRGLLVTRFSNVELTDINSMALTGYTRDGLWLIEEGKISQALKNFRFMESPLFAFNSLVQLGPAQRVFRPSSPAFVPPAKIRDFNFTAIVDIV